MPTLQRTKASVSGVLQRTPTSALFLFALVRNVELILGTLPLTMLPAPTVF